MLKKVFVFSESGVYAVRLSIIATKKKLVETAETEGKEVKAISAVCQWCQERISVLK